MTRLCLAAARFCSAAWIGAACLFVATSVAEQTQPSFVHGTKDTLALIRFPWYYGTGFGLLAATCLAVRFAGLPPRPRTAATLLVLAALALMASDYVFVYRPMRVMLAATDRGPAFARLHAWSEGLNAVGFVLSATAAASLCAAQQRASDTVR